MAGGALKKVPATKSEQDRLQACPRYPDLVIQIWWLAPFFFFLP
jgi:hypothetical protein